MKFLFVLDQVEAPRAANPVLGRRLAAALLTMGHEVHLLELWDGATPLPAPPTGAVRHDIPFADEAAMEKALEGGAAGSSPLPLRLARLAVQPKAVGAAWRQFVLHAPRRVTAARAALERLDAEQHFDVICAVCAPYRAAFALESADVRTKKVLWQLDPYAANRSYNAPGGYAREKQLLDAMSAAFVTPADGRDYAPDGPLAACRGKVHVLGFPVMTGPVPDTAAGTPRRCVFCGTLHRGIREPGRALALFAALNAPDWALHLVGPGQETFQTEIEQARRTLSGRLVTGGPVPREQAAALQAGAEVLLSLGNVMDNQLPSKLFEYFAAGKPVLHIAETENDPALPYLARYPLALVLLPGEDIAEQAERLRRWLADVTGRRVPYAEVTALYQGFTPQGTAREFLNGIS